jgi:RimJ/RimL family protein N-acetyltransferase
MALTFDRIAWPVRTKRLSVRPSGEADVDATWRYRHLDEVGRWITSAPTSPEEYRALFMRGLDTTLVFELDGTVIGDLMLAVENAWAQSEIAARARGVQAELGWVLDPTYAGQGYATEAVAALIRICFEDLALRRVTASCFADNVASWRLMERLGMRREVHTLRESLHRSGEWLDGMGYALLADEWRAQQTR